MCGRLASVFSGLLSFSYGACEAGRVSLPGLQKVAGGGVGVGAAPLFSPLHPLLPSAGCSSPETTLATGYQSLGDRTRHS